MATTPQTMDRQTFLAHIRQSKLLSDEQLAKVGRRLPDSNRALVVAKHLIDHGLLTKFQVELLLHGKTGGFFLGQYRILDYLGRGGMGRVFKAEHQTMNRVVALKVLASHLTKTPKAQQLFQREVRAAAKLVHPNIVTAYDANQVGDRFYLVMEFVDGSNLEDLIRQHGALPIGLACDFVRQAAIGLQHAHELGMVHRDIKPANLLVQKPTSRAPHAVCNVKILDFGLARLQSWNSTTNQPGGDSIMAVENTVLGTPDFISPEQARNLHQVDIRSDLYSLGCTFYFLLTGRVPFAGGTTLEKLVRHSTEQPVPIERHRPEASPPVAAILRKLLAKDPRQRFQSPAELAAALAPFSVQGPAPAAVPVGGSAPASPSTAGASAWTSTTPGQSGPLDNDDDAIALGTLPLHAGTPLSITGMPSMRLAHALRMEHKRRIKIAIMAGAGIVVALIGAVALLLR